MLGIVGTKGFYSSNDEGLGFRAWVDDPKMHESGAVRGHRQIIQSMTTDKTKSYVNLRAFGNDPSKQQSIVIKLWNDGTDDSDL
jgi:hypothetical protein